MRTRRASFEPRDVLEHVNTLTVDNALQCCADRVGLAEEIERRIRPALCQCCAELGSIECLVLGLVFVFRIGHGDNRLAEDNNPRRADAEL